MPSVIFPPRGIHQRKARPGRNPSQLWPPSRHNPLWTSLF